MRRVLALLALATAVSLAARLVFAPSGFTRDAAPDHACKPLAPIEVTLLQGPPAGPSNQPVTFSIRPVCAMSSVAWSWELSPGVVLGSGTLAGTAAAVAGATTSGGATLSVPADGAFHAATLRVTGVLAGSDENGPTGPEPVSVSSRITWGQMPSTVPEVLSPDGATGSLQPVASVPASHEGPP